MITFYHACLKENTPSILKRGLLRSKSFMWVRSGGAVYVTKDPCWMNKSADHDVLRLDLPESFIEKIEIWPKGWRDSKEDWQFIIWRDIPQRFIKLERGEDT